MFNNYKDTSGYYSRQPTYQDDINQPPLVPKEGSKQTSAPPWDLSQPHPTYNYCADQHLPAQMPPLMQRQVVSYDNTPPLYRSYNNTNNQHVVRPKALITCQSNCNRVDCCSKDVPRVPHHWNLTTDKSNGNVSRSTICKGVSQPVSQHISSVETGSRPIGNIDCVVKEFPRFHRDIPGSDQLGMNIPQFKNDLVPQQEGSIPKQLSVTNSESANNLKKDTSLHCQRSCAPNGQQYDHQASKFSLSGQTQLNVTAPSVSNQWLCDSQTRMWSLQNKQPQCVMPLEGVDMTVNNPVASNYWLERAREKHTVPVPTSKSSYQDMFEYQIQQEQHQKYAQHYQDPDRLKMMERVRYQESLRNSQQQPSDWAQDIPRRRKLPPYPVPRYANVNNSTRPNHDPLVVNSSLPPTYPYTHSKVPFNYTDPTQYSSRFNSTYTQAQSKMVSKSNNSFNPHVHSTHTTNIVPANCIRPTIIQHQPPHFAANVDMNPAQTGKSLQYVPTAQSYNNQSYTSCNEVYNNVNYSKNMQVVDKPCLNTPRIIQPYSMYDKNIDPFYKSIGLFGQNTGPMTRNLIYDKSMPPRQTIYDQSYNTENLQSTTSHQQLDNYMAAFHTTRPTQENVGLLGSHALPQNAVFGQTPTSISQVESETGILADGSDRPIKKRKPQLAGYEKPLGMDLRQFIETWEEEPEDVPYQTLPDTDSNKVDLRKLGDSGGMLEETNADSSVIKLYPTDSEGIHAEKNNPGTSVIKPLNKHQQSCEQPTLSSEKVDVQEVQEPILHLKSTGNNESANSPSGILQNLLSSSEEGASPVEEFLRDELTGRPAPKLIPKSDTITLGPQSSCGYKQSKPLTDDESLEQTLRETKYRKSILANDDQNDLVPNGKHCVKSELKELCHTPLAENVNSGQNQVNDIDLPSASNENLNRKRQLSEEMRPYTQSSSSINAASVKSRHLVNVEDFEQMLPECNSVYMPNSPKNVLGLENVPLAGDKDTIKTSIENTSGTDKLLECGDLKLTSSKDMPVGSFTSTTPKNPSDSLLLTQNINISCTSLMQVKSTTGNIPKEKNINQNLPKESNVGSLSPQVAKIAHRSSSRPRPFSRKRKCLQEKNVEEETTVEDKSSKHLLSSPIEAAENSSGENLNVVSKTSEIATLESALTVNRSIDCLAKIMDNTNNTVHVDVCTRLHMSSGVSEVIPLPLATPAAVSSTSTLKDLSPQYANTQLNSDSPHLKPVPKEDSDENAQEVSVTVPDKLLIGNEVVSVNDRKSTHTRDGSLVMKPSSLCTSRSMFGLPGINPILADKCNAIQNSKAAILCDQDVDLPVAANTKSHHFNMDSSLQSISPNISSESSPLLVKETSCRLAEKIPHNLQNVVSSVMPPSRAMVPSPPLEEETQQIVEVVKEKSAHEVFLSEDPKTAALKPNALCLHPSLSESCKSNEDSNTITQFTESCWISTTINLRKTVKLGQSQLENNTGNGSSEIYVNKPLDSLSMIDSEMNNQVETMRTVGEIQSTDHTDNGECGIDAPQRFQSLDKCPNSVIRYISSEILEESVTTKHAIAEPEFMHELPDNRVKSSSNTVEPCVAEESQVGNKSCPIQLKHTYIVGSKKAVKMQEPAPRGSPRKSKLLSVRIVKKNCNDFSMYKNRIGSTTGTDEQPKECLQVQEECSILELDAMHSSSPEMLNENIGFDFHDSCDESNIGLRPVELSKSWDNGVNAYKTKTYEISPDKQVEMTEEAQVLNTNVKQAVSPHDSTGKLPPQNQETQSQPCVSCDESNDDVLDLDTSYDFDMQTEEESHSTNKESLLHSGSKPISVGNVSHKSVNLNSNDEEDYNNMLNMGLSYNDSKMVVGTVGLPYGDHAKPDVDATACIRNVGTSSETISKSNALSIHPTFHEDALIAQVATSFPEENGKMYSKSHLEQNTVDCIEIKNIPLNASNKARLLGINDFSSKFSNSEDKIQHPVKTTFPTQDEPVPCNKSNKSDSAELLKHVETLQIRECNLLTDVSSDSTTKRNFIKPQQSFFKSRRDRVRMLKLSSSDEPEALFTKSGQDTNLQTVLDKPHLITDANVIGANSVPSTVDYVTKPHDGCFFHKQEHVTLVNQNLENEMFETLGNEGLSLTEGNVCLLNKGQGLGNCGNLNVGLQENNTSDCLLEDGLYKKRNVSNKSPTGSDGVDLVNSDRVSTDDDADTLFKDKCSGAISYVKNECLLQDVEQDHTNKSSDVGQPIDSTHDGVAVDIPTSRDKLQSLDDLDDIVKCNKFIHGTLHTGKCSMEGVLVERLSTYDSSEEVIKRNEFDCKNGNTSGLAIAEDQCSSTDDEDLRVNTVGEQQLDNGANLKITIPDNRDDCEHENALVMPITLDKNLPSMEDTLSVPQNRDEHLIDSCHEVKNLNEGYCKPSNGFGVEMDRPKDEEPYDGHINHDSNIPLDTVEFLSKADLDEHSKDCHTEHDSDVPLDKDDCSVEADLGMPLSSRDGGHSVHVDEIVNCVNEVDRQMCHGSSVEEGGVEHLKGDHLDVLVSKEKQFIDYIDKTCKDSCESSDTSCIDITEDKKKSLKEERHLMNTNDSIKDQEYDSQTPSSSHVEMDEVEHLMEDNFDASVINRDSCESCYVSHITVDKNEHSVENDVHIPVSQQPQNVIDNNLHKDMNANGDSQTSKSLDVDTDECSKKDSACELLRNYEGTSQLDNDLDLNHTVLHNNEKCSMSDKTEEGKYMAGNSLEKVHCTFITAEDLAKMGAKDKSTVRLLPMGIEHYGPNEQFKEIIHSNSEGTSGYVPRQAINDFSATMSNSSNKLEVKSCTNSEQSSVLSSSLHIDSSKMVCEEKVDGVLEVHASYSNTHQEIETECSKTSYEDPVANAGKRTAPQTYFECNQIREKVTTEAGVFPEYSDSILYPTTGQNNSPLDLNLETSMTSEEEGIKIAVPIGEMCDADTLSNSSESPEMPFLEVISDLNSSIDQKAAYESRCDSDTEMPLLEKFTDSPTSYTEDRRLPTTTSKLYEENCELIPEPSGNWSCVDQSEEHCTDASCVDVIPVDSVSNWPYLEEEVFSEVQITGSPQVELPCSGVDDVPSDQRFTSSSDTETEPDSLKVPSTNTALDIVSYKNREIDMEKESLNVTAPSADLKCRLSWKKIFNLAKVEERKKQHRVGEAKNRKEAYRRWPYYGKTGHKRRSLKSPNKLSTSVDKCDKELSNSEMSSNDIDGLVLGPAKIEFRLAPKSQSERWQVVDGSKAITLCGEENNNVADISIPKTLKTQSPIVLVKRIILKRRGDDNHIPKNIPSVPQNDYPCSTSMSNPPTTCLNKPISSATLTIPSIHTLNEANCESEFSCLTTPPESDDSSTSLKTLERLPKVIIKRTGYGNAKYKSFLRLSAAAGSNWQPFVRLERKKYLDNLAKQLFPQRDLTNEDIRNPTQQPIPIALAMSNHPQEVHNRSSNENDSTYNLVPTNPDDVTSPESVLGTPVDLHQEHDVSKKLCKGTYTTIKRHSKDIKLTFQLSNSNKECTEVCDTDKKIKQGIVNNRLVKTNELDKCEERALKTVKHTARRCSEGGPSQEKKKPEYRERIGSEGANSGSLKPKKRLSNDGALWHTDENKSKMAKTNLKDKESVESSDDQYNRAPEKAVAKEHVWKKSLKQKLKVITCQACNYCVKNEVEQSAHIRQHPYHCQKCSVAFKSEDDFKSHLSVKHPLTKELHHCLLCKLSFPSAKQHQQHLADRQHRHLDLTQRWTIQTLFKMFTGEGCSRITPLTDSEVTEMSKLTDAEPGAINYYHQATPLQLAVQDLLKQSRKLPNAGVPVSSPRQQQDTNDLI